MSEAIQDFNQFNEEMEEKATQMALMEDFQTFFNESLDIDEEYIQNHYTYNEEEDNVTFDDIEAEENAFNPPPENLWGPEDNDIENGSENEEDPDIDIPEEEGNPDDDSFPDFSDFSNDPDSEIDSDGLGDGSAEPDFPSEPDIPESAESEPEDNEGTSKTEPEIKDEQPAEQPEEEDKDPLDGVDLDKLTPKEQQELTDAHLKWVRRKREREKAAKAQPPKPVPAAETSSQEAVRKENENSSTNNPENANNTEEPKPKGQGLLSSVMQRKRDELKRRSDKKTRDKTDETNSATFEKSRETVNDIRNSFEAAKVEKLIDDIVMSVTTFTQNGVDHTSEKKKEIEQRDKQNELANAAQNNNTSDAASEEPLTPSLVSEENTAITPAATEKEDKIKDEVEFERKEPKRLREYNNGEAPKEKINYAKAKDIDDDEMKVKSMIVAFILIGLGASTYISLQANAYYNYRKGKADIIECVQAIFFEDYPFSIEPINNITYILFLIIVAAVAGIGFMTISETKAKIQARVNHEHGNARFGKDKDFIKFKKDFMDMSLTNEKAAETKKGKGKKK